VGIGLVLGDPARGAAPNPKSGGPGISRLSFDRARTLGLTAEMFSAAMTAGAGRPVVDRALADLKGLPRAHVEAIVPRDLDTAPPRLRELMNLVYDGEPRRVSLKELAQLLPPALARFSSTFQRRLASNKTNREALESLKPLWLEVARATVDHLAGDYFSAVVRRGEPSSLYLAKLGAQRGDLDMFRTKLLGYVPKPSLDDRSRLYRLALDGKLGARDFYIATGLSNAGLRALQAKRPTSFPRPEGLRDRDALPHLSAPEQPKLDPEVLEAKFQELVVKGGKSVAEFCVLVGVRPSAWAELRRHNPKLKANVRYGVEDVRAIAKKANELFAENPLLEVEALVAAINADEAFVEAHGVVELQRYNQSRRLGLARFPDLRNGWVKPLRKRLDEILAEGAHPATNGELVERVKEVLPEFTSAHLKRLRRETGFEAPGEERAAEAPRAVQARQLLPALLAKSPNASASALRAALARRGVDIRDSDIRRIVQTVRPRSVVAGRDLQSERNSLVMRQLLQLIIRTSPPGTDYLTMMKRWDEELVKRGVPSLEVTEAQVQSHASYYWTPAESPRVHHAKVTAELLAEYAAAAPTTDGSSEIMARVVRDYPSLDRYKLGGYLKMWRAEPRAYPALAPFMRGGELALRGLGKSPAAPRFLGGWDVERAVLGASAEERATVARLTQALHVPVRLAELDEVIDDLRGSRPLAQSHFLWVTHQLADTVPMSFALRAMGLRPAQAVVVGSPYGSNGVIRDTLRDGGFDVRIPKLDPAALRAEVERAIDDMLARANGDDQRIVVLDDGGMVSKLLHERLRKDPTLERVIGRVRIVEQTSGGINLAEHDALRVSMVAVARSRSKKAEAEYIGRVVSAKIMQAMRRTGRDLKGMRVVIGGYGFLGPELSKAMERAGARVTVLENDPQKQARIPPRLRATNKADALRRADLVIGATGNHDEPFMSLDDFRLLKDGAMFASASSKRVEADMTGLARVARRSAITSDNPLVTLPSASYQLGRRTITVLGDGWPVNFDGGVQSVPPHLIALTDAALLAGIIQVCSGRQTPGLKPLDPKVDARILARHRERVKKSRERLAIYDPGGWQDDLRAFAR
jgi:S-adenosylhomocysteine hydrolase